MNGYSQILNWYNKIIDHADQYLKELKLARDFFSLEKTNA
jgi:hypothetical protein